MNAFTNQGSAEQMNLIDADRGIEEGLVLLLMQQSILPENTCKQPRDLHTLMWASNH